MINLPAHFYVPVRDRAVGGCMVPYAKTAFEIPIPALAVIRRVPWGAAGDARPFSSGNASANAEGTGGRVAACMECASVSAFALSVLPAREGIWHRPQT